MTQPTVGKTPALTVAGLELVIAAFVVLFQELALIRWLPSQVRVIAYFPNVVLISAFLGLGVGCLRAGKKPLLAWWPASLLLLLLVAVGLGRIAFTQESVSEHLWLLYYDIPNAPVINEVRLPIIALFVLCAATFVPLGQFVAERLRVFREGGASLWGYSCDLLGSLIGVIGFAVASFLRTFPVVWFAAFLLPAVYLLWQIRPRMVGLACAALALLVVVWSEKAEQYSPYYAIGTHRAPGNAGVHILTNGSLHQYAAPTANNSASTNDVERKIRDGYHSPYRLLKAPPKRVLVLGAGTGNDVSVALDEGAEHVDAVEIDPVILSLGEREHPNRPYLSPRVRTINTDARAFLNKTDEKYDLIVFGTLDSMTRLSALSGVRLDNFVYTADCIAAAKRHLTPGGGIVMYFMVSAEYIHQRLFKMLYDAFGEPPLVQNESFELFNAVLAAGPAFAHVRPPIPPADRASLEAQLADVEIPHDDWPYLYLRSRGITPFYISLIIAFVIISVAGVYWASPQVFRRGTRTGGGFDAEMFLFGIAFLLLETKSVTEMNLVWGVTWLTSAVVFGSILAMLLVSTVVMQLRPLPWTVCVVGLIVSLLASYAVPTHALLGHDTAMKLLLSGAFVGLPIFFASTCFALRFKVRTAPDAAFGWNLQGAVVGGFLEFSSMAIGFRNLSLVALTAYLMAFLFGRRQDPPGRR
jgi:hypothetical protein